ncbi:MAG: hypothetical protein ACOCZS_01795 [Verrucomicrobiota bacterium]
MIRKLNKYHLLLALAIFSALGFLIVYRVKVTPLRKEKGVKLEKIEEKVNRLTETDLPLSLRKLKERLTAEENKLAKLEETQRTLKQRVGNTFSDRIRENFGQEAVDNPATFNTYVTRLDYQEHYDKIIQKWQEKDVFLVNPLLNLRKNTTAAKIHLVLLQLWSLETIIDLTLEQGLKPILVARQDLAETEETETGSTDDGQEPPDHISAVRSNRVNQYIMDNGENAEKTTLFEFPVSLTVECAPDELTSFLNSLNTGNRFVSLNHIEVKRKLPGKNNGAADNVLLHVEMECSTFYISEDRQRQ